MRPGAPTLRRGRAASGTMAAYADLEAPHPRQAPPRSARPRIGATRSSATVDLPGVPTGTSGKVILANGFNWMRYRVRFENGAELADLDGRHLEPTGRTARRLAKRGRVATT